MSVYTVHEPPLRADEQTPDPNRIVFVRDGFHVWAFLLTPLWMLWHGLWLVLALYVVALGSLEWAAVAAGASPRSAFAVAALVSLLVGLEAGTLRRWTLTRRGWSHAGVVVGDDAEAAERRFFDSWAERDSTEEALATPPSAPASSARLPQPREIIGLFPQPGARR